MKRFQKSASLLAAVAMLTTSLPCAAATPTNPTTLDPLDRTEDAFDGQAYYAARYVPALRPGWMVTGLLITGLIVIILQDKHHGHHSH